MREETRMALERAVEGGGKGDDAGDGPLGNGSGSGNTREGGRGGRGSETLKSEGISIVRDKVLLFICMYIYICIYNRTFIEEVRHCLVDDCETVFGHS